MSMPFRQLPEMIGDLDADECARLVRALTYEEAREWDWDWGSWAHPGQLPEDLCANGAPWRTWVIMAGRGFGKTLAGAKWITGLIAAQAEEGAEPLHIALVGATLDEARRVMVEGRSGLLAVADAWVTEWHPSLRRLEFRTGAVATLFSGASPAQLRGPEHHVAWCDEMAKWEKPRESWDMLQLGLRLGDWPRALITTTPRPGPVLSGIIAAPDTIRTGGPTSANPHNPKAFVETTTRLYAGTRLGRQELDGELLTDAPGALWTVELIARCRAQGSDCGAIARQREEPSSVGQPAPCNGDRTDVTGMAGDGIPRIPKIAPGERSTLPWSRGGPFFPAFTRIVIGVDPPASDGTCGIIACAKDADGIAHILADHSVTAQSPEGWARAVADAVRIHSCKSSPAFAGEGDHAEHGGGAPPPRSTRSPSPGKPGEDRRTLIPTVVAESNQGGKMVKSVLHTADPALRVKLVTATVGKAERAAPVAMLFEAGRVVLHGRFPELEAEMLGMIAGGGYEGPGTSPDRADAMVWGLTELMLQPEPAPPRVRGF
jgi:phage terminase large subunit-like protein